MLPDDASRKGHRLNTGGPEADRPEQGALLRTLVRGGRLEIVIEPQQAIVQANTPHRAGQRVTLLGIDAERLLLDNDALDRIRLQPASLDELDTSCTTRQV
jgi:hypothetical protein